VLNVLTAAGTRAPRKGRKIFYLKISLHNPFKQKFNKEVVSGWWRERSGELQSLHFVSKT